MESNSHGTCLLLAGLVVDQVVRLATRIGGRLPANADGGGTNNHHLK